LKELEAELQTSEQGANRAEERLHKIYSEVEERFNRRPEDKRRSVFGTQPDADSN
jgi:hypothetical protein